MQPYRQRKPHASPLWQCLTRHFHVFLAAYEALFQSRYGFLHPIIPEVTPCEFIAAITQHIPDKSFQLVRYYGWYSNKMRGQRDKQAAAAAVQPDGKAAAVIDVSEHKPRRIPSARWRELINPPSRKATADLREGLSHAPLSAGASA